MTELVVSSFGRAKGLQGCRLLIVADGPRILSGGSETTKSGKTLLKNGGGKDAVQRRRMRPKQGIVDAEGAARYTAYKQAINKLCGDPCIPFFCNAELIELESRVGFGHAVQKGLALARTDYVCVVQHDRAFLRNVDMHCVMQGFANHPDINYQLLATKSVINYRQKMLGQHRLRLAEDLPVRAKLLPSQNKRIEDSIDNTVDGVGEGEGRGLGPAKSGKDKNEVDTERQGIVRPVYCCPTGADTVGGTTIADDRYDIPTAHATPTAPTAPTVSTASTAPTAAAAAAATTTTTTTTAAATTATTITATTITATKKNPKIASRPICNCHLTPLLFWYDSTHVARRKIYQRLVFDATTDGEKGQLRVRRGDFIEDTYGQWMLNLLKSSPQRHSAEFGTYIFYDDDVHTPMVGHINGRRFLPAKERKAKGLPPKDYLAPWFSGRAKEKNTDTLAQNDIKPGAQDPQMQAISLLSVQASASEMISNTLALERLSLEEE